jgi:BirA family biotin operon repressor/biotin-[acetyl-CoA-carboxylase] ligase
LHLGQAAARAGYRLECYDRLGSTNDEASGRASLGDPGRLWIVAAEQSKGRGRLGRVWSSPPGNLYASLLLIDPAPPHVAAQLGFVAGVALATAVRGLLGGDARARLKWPNDLLYNDAKLSGLLLESVVCGGGLACTIGFGVNCLTSPTDAPYPTTNLRAIGATFADRENLFAELSDALAYWLEIWARGENFAKIRGAWLSHAGGIGGPARVMRRGVVLHGLFRGIDAQGRMLLETGSGAVETIEAGDVAFGNGPGGFPDKAG